VSDTTSPEQPVEQSSETVGRTTPLDIPTQRKLAGYRLSTQFGFMLYLQYQAKLSEGQWAYLMMVQRRLKFEELQRSLILFRGLVSSSRVQARAAGDLQHTLDRMPSLAPKLIRREQRRIGVGYRDKGSLRQPHEDHQADPRLWWWEDICSILHLSPDWIVPEDLVTEEDLDRGIWHRTIQAMYMVGNANFCSPFGPTPDSLIPTLRSLGFKETPEIIEG
jgi:hypothetical protein